LQILKIHTRQLKEEGLLDDRLDLAKIARLAKNYTGAELESVVRNAVSLAMSIGNDVNDFSKQLTTKKGTKVTQ
jgi:SpoVK/Ycf46/Vps4 family AAA+-type ATPase